MLIGLVVLAVLAVVAVGVALADRSLAALAERTASAYLADPFGHPPTVRMHATPFVTQALRGCYRDVQVSSGGLRVGEIGGAVLDARLVNVRLPLRELLARSTTEVVCERVVGQLLMPYRELVRASHVPGLDLAFDQGRLIAAAALPVPGIGALARVSGQARLLVDGNAVWLRVSGLSVAGLGVTALVLRQLVPRMNVAIPLPALPWGLHIDELEPTANGLLVHASAGAVVFRADPRLSNRDSDPAY